MKLDLEGRTHLVGGASRGLGRAVTAELVAGGARVLALSRTRETLDALREELGDAVLPLAADIAAPDAVATVQRAVADAGGRLDGVVINGGGPPAGRALALSDEQWLGAYELLIGGPLRLLRALVPTLKADDGGSVVFITSSSVRQPIPGLDTSNVLRPGVAALAKVLARELGPEIRVNSVGPGRFDTDRGRSLDTARSQREGISVEEARAAVEATIPLGRYGDPAELGRLVAFLLSDAGSYVSGAAVQVDGGSVTAVP
ncbi:SDR family oxidoreductase [Conexibacter sp. CPCC 206217]|uniref:SDR family oxidoreductase n=1 Tax=Conexibacter sp. CPCC 206217 TaxID=3064574 RepID=UPI002725B025|nr:SDR family oxidoreductase [Conexibacter sp. CPCC 206217]MDO8213673.1 SDR family oxidoreductase [Conexibacter sp. CPCC 206217]